MTAPTDQEPPRYTDIASDTVIVSSPHINPRDSTPPPYRSEFKTALQDEAGYAWLVLRVNSRSPDVKTRPFFIEGDNVLGVVELDAAKTESVKAVYVEIQAGTTAIGQEEKIFLSLKETLWTQTEGVKMHEKLEGKHNWSFGFILPKEVEVTGPHGKKGFYRLPPSFSERGSPAYLDYKIVVTVKRGLLKVNQKLTTTFAYQPLTVPDSSPSPLMKLAYAEGKQLPSPKQDSEGWKVLPKFEIEGVLFGGKKVQVICELSIARPLQYGLSSPISLRLVIESEDIQALDILSSPTAMHIGLVRVMTTGSEATAPNQEKRSDNFFTEVVSGGYFWGVDEPGIGPNQRVLHGEIEVENKLKPTFVFPRLSIEYTVNFLGFEATGWIMKSRGHKEGLLSPESVKITSMQLAGATMRSNAPPGHQKPNVDYNKGLGYLENGNQRFLAHHGGW